MKFNHQDTEFQKSLMKEVEKLKDFHNLDLSTIQDIVMEGMALYLEDNTITAGDALTRSIKNLNDAEDIRMFGSVFMGEVDRFIRRHPTIAQWDSSLIVELKQKIEDAHNSNPKLDVNGAFEAGLAALQQVHNR
ncbi:MAG: hypothetical protein EBQ80_04320 [Proteobacteria bacterium]|nr:hypothetical protein [Pseudomonadota bacterium]